MNLTGVPMPGKLLYGDLDLKPKVFRSNQQLLKKKHLTKKLIRLSNRNLIPCGVLI